MIEMSRKEAIGRIQEHIRIHSKKEPFTPYLDKAFSMAIEALMDNKPSRTWIAKNEYRRGWHDAIIKALSEVMEIYVGNEIFDMVQKETLIGLGLSMDSALGAEPYSETEESYPESERTHGEWIGDTDLDGTCKCSTCRMTFDIDRLKMVMCDGKYEMPSCCPNCGSDNRKKVSRNEI